MVDAGLPSRLAPSPGIERRRCRSLWLRVRVLTASSARHRRPRTSRLSRWPSGRQPGSTDCSRGGRSCGAPARQGSRVGVSEFPPRSNVPRRPCTERTELALARASELLAAALAGGNAALAVLRGCSIQPVSQAAGGRPRRRRRFRIEIRGARLLLIGSDWNIRRTRPPGEISRISVLVSAFARPIRLRWRSRCGVSDTGAA